MSWESIVLFACLGLLTLGVPAAVLYGVLWWRRRPGAPGWRLQISQLGVAYSLLVLGGMIAFGGALPHLPRGAEFPFVYRWAPVIARGSAVSFIFAALGEGRVRFAFAAVAVGGIAFAITMLALL